MAAIDQHEQDERRKLNKGFGAALNNAFEIAMVPAVFAGAGWLVDRLAGTGWVFTAILAVIGVTGTFVKLYYRYSYEMVQMEEAGPWRRTSQAQPQAQAPR